MKMNKTLTNEIIAAAESLDIQDLFEACAWLRDDGVMLFGERGNRIVGGQFVTASVKDARISNSITPFTSTLTRRVLPG